MGEIYSKAKQVIIWLGRDTGDVDTVLWAQKIVHDKYFKLKVEQTGMDLTFLRGLGITPEEWIDRWDNIDRFFRRRRWFGRAWVFQEVVLANSVQLRNGKVLFDWKKLGSFAQISRESGIPMPSMGTFRVLHAFVPEDGAKSSYEDQSRRDDHALMFSIDTEVQHWYLYLFLLVVNLRALKTSCEHDKIYAALGISQRNIPPEISRTVVPDYASPWEDSFIDFTAIQLRELPNLLLLSYVESAERSLSVPSWCPDYRFHNIIPLFTIYATAPNMQFTAAGPLGTSESINYLHDKVLSVNGLCVDKVVQCTVGLQDVLKAGGSESVDCIFDISSNLPQCYPFTQQDRLEVLWRTLILDQHGEGDSLTNPAELQISEYFLEWVRGKFAFELYAVHDEKDESASKVAISDRMCKWKRVFKDSPLQLYSMEAVYEMADQLINPSDGLTSIFDAYSKADRFTTGDGIFETGSLVIGRCLFRTLSHDLLGLGPEKAEPGDELWLIREARVPFILRPLPNGQYTLIGQAYVHGIMHGEWLDRLGEDAEFRALEIV
jgi:hypothetical protein